MRLGLRCLQLDLARQKETIAFVKQYADFAAEHGYNALVLYLENAVRTDSTPFFREEETYSVEEMKEIVSYAVSLGLDVIPALENLGHLEKFFLYPELEDLSEITDVETQGRGFDRYPRGACGCLSNPRLLEFTDRYIREVCALFPSVYVHMGLDEPFDLAVCDRCRAAIAAGQTKSELFLEHILHTHRLCQSMGKTMMMWDDFFEYADIVKDVPRDIVLCNWNYVFVGDEPQGHWTNRIKQDWFRLYDELGFRYLYCVYAHRASSSYNVDTFDAYAAKYHPTGAIMTTWRRSDSFYQGAYPVIAYAGAKWSGRASCEDKTAIYATLLEGNRACAELIAALNIVENGCNLNITEVCENDSMLKHVYRDALRYAVPRLRAYVESMQGSARDIATDLYDYVYEIALNLDLQRLAVDWFDRYETRQGDVAPYLARLDAVEAGFYEIKRNGDALWAKYRDEIASFLDRYEKKFARYFDGIAWMRAQIERDGRRGVLYAELMLHDPYPTIHNEIHVGYADGVEEVVFRCALKPSVALFEWGGCYGYRFAVRDRKIEWMTFSVWGEGAIFPTHFRYVTDGKKYVADTAAAVEGDVYKTENLLRDDTRFAVMGNNDGVAHFNDLELSRRRHTVRVTFRPMTEEV